MMFVRTLPSSITVLPAFLIVTSTVSSTSSDVPGATSEGLSGSAGSAGSAGSSGVVAVAFKVADLRTKVPAASV